MGTRIMCYIFSFWHIKLQCHSHYVSWWIKCHSNCFSLTIKVLFSSHFFQDVFLCFSFLEVWLWWVFLRLVCVDYISLDLQVSQIGEVSSAIASLSPAQLSLTLEGTLWLGDGLRVCLRVLVTGSLVQDGECERWWNFAETKCCGRWAPPSKGSNVILENPPVSSKRANCSNEGYPVCLVPAYGQFLFLFSIVLWCSWEDLARILDPQHKNQEQNKLP